MVSLVPSSPYSDASSFYPLDYFDKMTPAELEQHQAEKAKRIHKRRGSPSPSEAGSFAHEDELLEGGSSDAESDFSGAMSVCSSARSIYCDSE